MPVYHKPKQNIPDIWRGRFYLIPLQSEMLNNKKQSYETKNDYWTSIHCSQLNKIGNHLGNHRMGVVRKGIRGALGYLFLHRSADICRREICCSVRYGGDEYIYRGEPFHGARLDAFFGGIRMDLRNAAITEDEEIEIHTFFGGIELFVPQTVNVLVKSRSFIGGVGNHASRTAEKDAHCLHIIADNFIGGVDIKN